MSYDLYFLKPLEVERPTVGDLTEYFLSRPNFHSEGDQVWYENEETGVYFSFDIGDSSGLEDDFDDEEETPPEDGYDSAGIAFNINYFRPHIFGLEAAPELAAFVDCFRFRIDDPQSDGMGRAEFTEAGFLEGWNAGNLFGYRACLNRQGNEEPSLMTMPGADIERLWKWNYHRQSLQQTIDVDAYVSLVRILAINGEAKSFVVWGDGIPEAFPEVDYIMIVRDSIARRSFFRKKTDSCLVPFDAFKPILPIARRVSEPVPHFLFDYEEPPKEVISLFTSQTPFEGQLDRVGWDHLLNSELVSRATSS